MRGNARLLPFRFRDTLDMTVEKQKSMKTVRTRAGLVVDDHCRRVVKSGEAAMRQRGIDPIQFVRARMLINNSGFHKTINSLVRFRSGFHRRQDFIRILCILS